MRHLLISSTAPHLMPAQVSSVLRRSERSGGLSAAVAAVAHADLLDLSVEVLSYEPYAGRIWQLRNNITVYDAWYVALAETLEANLATLDLRLASAVGPPCQFVTPP